MNFFGFRKATPPAKPNPASTAETIRNLRDQVETLEKRQLHLETKIALMLEDAKKKSAANDKRGALYALKRKKMYENEMLITTRRLKYILKAKHEGF